MAVLKVDTIISKHPFVDGSVERMKDLAARQPGEPNPFVMGTDAAQRYVAILGKCAEVWVARNAAGLDDLGQPVTQVNTPERKGLWSRTGAIARRCADPIRRADHLQCGTCRTEELLEFVASGLSKKRVGPATALRAHSRR